MQYNTEYANHHELDCSDIQYLNKDVCYEYNNSVHSYCVANGTRLWRGPQKWANVRSRNHERAFRYMNGHFPKMLFLTEISREHFPLNNVFLAV